MEDLPTHRRARRSGPELRTQSSAKLLSRVKPLSFQLVKDSANHVTSDLQAELRKNERASKVGRARKEDLASVRRVCTSSSHNSLGALVKSWSS